MLRRAEGCLEEADDEEKDGSCLMTGFTIEDGIHRIVFLLT